MRYLVRIVERAYCDTNGLYLVGLPPNKNGDSIIDTGHMILGPIMTASVTFITTIRTYMSTCTLSPIISHTISNISNEMVGLSVMCVAS